MTVFLADLKLYGSQVMPDDDSVLAIGGAIDRTKRLAFFDVSGFVQVVSSTSVDTTQQVQVFGRDATGTIVNETQTLVGLTPVAYATNWNRLLKGLKNASCVGDIAVEATVATLTGSLAGATLFDVTLPAGASGVDAFYNNQILRLTGTSKSIRRVINYVGATRLATVDHPYTKLFPTTGDDMAGTGDSFRLATGFHFERNPNQIIQIRRPFYNASADVPGGLTKKYYDKGFWENTSPTQQTLGSVQAVEAADPSGKIAFALATSFNDTGTNGGGNNRQVSPGFVFDSSTKNVPGGSGDMRAGSDIGIWFELTLSPGDAAQNTTYTPRLTGLTS